MGQLAVRYGTPVRRTTAQTAAALLAELASSPTTEPLIPDEAHRLPDASFEELRLLGQLDFDRRPPFVLFLAGQPLLRERLRQPDFEALWRRLVVRATLAPLTDRESGEFLDRWPRPSVRAQCSFAPAPSICSSSIPAASCAGSITWPPAPCSPPRAPAASTLALPMCRPAVFDDEHA